MTLKEIWMVMKAMYPHGFKEYGPVNGPVYAYWSSELAGEDMANGYAALKVRRDKFPPSLPEFKDLCGLLPSLPGDDNQLMGFAERHGLPAPGYMETSVAYRKRLEKALQTPTESGQRLLT